MVHAFSFLVAAIIFCSVLFFVFFHTLILLASTSEAGPAEQWLFPPVLDAVQGGKRVSNTGHAIRCYPPISPPVPLDLELGGSWTAKMTSRLVGKRI